MPPQSWPDLSRSASETLCTDSCGIPQLGSTCLYVAELSSGGGLKDGQSRCAMRLGCGLTRLCTTPVVMDDARSDVISDANTLPRAKCLVPNLAMFGM